MRYNAYMRPDDLLSKTRAEVEERLVRLCDERISQAAEVGDRYVLLWKKIKTIVLRGGKRIRPYLVMVGYGKYSESMLSVAVAQELVHIAMLIHDDIIDQDFIRHGGKNISGEYRDAYSKYLDRIPATHYANSAALMAGDALISESYLQINTAQFSQNIQAQLINRLGRSIFEVIGGELLDVEAAFVNDVAFDPLKIYRYKTASYSFIGPLLSGAICAGADGDTLQMLERFAEKIGVAYQLQDDLLGVFGDEKETGKSTLSDLREGKQTLLVNFHKDLMSKE